MRAPLTIAPRPRLGAYYAAEIVMYRDPYWRVVMTQSRACIMYNNIRGMDGRGWGTGDGLPMVSRVSL